MSTLMDVLHGCPPPHLDGQRSDDLGGGERPAGAVVQEERAHQLAGRLAAPALLHLSEERPACADGFANHSAARVIEARGGVHRGGVGVSAASSSAASSS